LQLIERIRAERLVPEAFDQAAEGGDLVRIAFDLIGGGFGLISGIFDRRADGRKLDIGRQRLIVGLPECNSETLHLAPGRIQALIYFPELPVDLFSRNQVQAQRSAEEVAKD